jgi:hypothetical protein
MPRGPLPDPNHRRRNKATIPTTRLPASGRPGTPPRLPSWVTLGRTGAAWWKWAWKTPQAAGWATGDESVVARRASLEDDLAALGHVDSLDALDVLGAENMRQVREVIGRLAALATGRIAVYREMRELDNLLGLTPKGMAALRWTIVDDKAPAKAKAKTAKVTDMEDARRQRLLADVP